MDQWNFQMRIAYLRRIAANCFNYLQALCLAVVTRRMQKELDRRDAKRRHGTLQWLLPDEIPIAEALADIIVPSDEDTPGIEEVGVLDPPAIVTLDSLIVKSSSRQQLYSRGLLGFDVWAQHRKKCKFTDMAKADQIALFRDTQCIYERWTDKGSVLTKAMRRLGTIIGANNGSFFASQLYPQIRDDCMQVFYTSRVSWVWLEYDGPPMDKGYPDLSARF